MIYQFSYSLILFIYLFFIFIEEPVSILTTNPESHPRSASLRCSWETPSQPPPCCWQTVVLTSETARTITVFLASLSTWLMASQSTSSVLKTVPVVAWPRLSWPLLCSATHSPLGEEEGSRGPLWVFFTTAKLMNLFTGFKDRCLRLGNKPRLWNEPEFLDRVDIAWATRVS